MANNKIIGIRLLNLRRQKDKTQAEVAKDLGIGRSTYVKYEGGDLRPSHKLKELADYYGVSTDYLLCRTNNPDEVLPVIQPLAELLADGDTRIKQILDTLTDEGAYCINGVWYQLAPDELSYLQRTISLIFRPEGTLV